MPLARTTAVALVLAVWHVPTAAGQPGWSVWVHNEARPGEVTVAAPGSLRHPWRNDGGVFASRADAWKRACWLTRQGDIYGRRYAAREIEAGRVVCDANCNCEG